MRSAPPKTLGGYRTQNFTPPPVTGGAPNNFPMHLNRRAGNIPLFIRCGAYRALLVKNALALCDRHPRKPEGGIERSYSKFCQLLFSVLYI